MRDTSSGMQIKRALSPVSVADNTPLVSQIIDRAGYDAVTFVLLTGTLTDADATFTVLVEEGDQSNLSDAAAVADADLVSQTPGVAPETAASFTFADDHEVRRIGYIGKKRYIRLTVTPANNAAAALIAACCVLEEPLTKPVTQAAS